MAISPVSPLPEISIHLAPPEKPLVEPFSPFSPNGPTTPKDFDGFRNTLLSPPPTVSPRFPRQLSPLRPADAPVSGRGLERERFEALLRASRERNAALGGKKEPDLRKEIAIKAHKSKQLERRALFLSKVQAPPSPTATLLPKTPPESPAIFHYSLPSPGLQSPLAVFESLENDNTHKSPREPWVEQVEFRMPGVVSSKPSLRSAPVTTGTKKRLPSLDQITARLTSQRLALSEGNVASLPTSQSARLPNFLRNRSPSPPTPTEAKQRPALPAGVGRLQFPVRSTSPPAPEPAAAIEIKAPSPRLPPSPCSPVHKLQITTTVVPRTSSRSPSEFTEDNLRALDSSRARTAQDMLSRLRKRALSNDAKEARPAFERNAEDERKLRRHSAPPELPARERAGFVKPILNLPGAF